MPRIRRPPALAGALLLGLACALPAAAQVRVTGTIASDARFRGRSVSEGRPVATLDVAYDAPDGAYAGAAVSGVADEHSGPDVLSAQVYGGYVARLKNGPTLDIGATATRYTRQYGAPAQRGGGRGYEELYAGLITERFATHLYYAPDYLGAWGATLYGEVESSIPAGHGWRILGHAGALRALDPPAPGWPRTQYDWRLALAHSLYGAEVQLAWAGLGSHADAYGGRRRGHSGLVISATRLF